MAKLFAIEYRNSKREIKKKTLHLTLEEEEKRVSYIFQVDFYNFDIYFVKIIIFCVHLERKSHRFMKIKKVNRNVVYISIFLKIRINK